MHASPRNIIQYHAIPYNTGQLDEGYQYQGPTGAVEMVVLNCQICNQCLNGIAPIHEESSLSLCLFV